MILEFHGSIPQLDEDIKTAIFRFFQDQRKPTKRKIIRRVEAFYIFQSYDPTITVTLSRLFKSRIRSRINALFQQITALQTQYFNTVLREQFQIISHIPRRRK